MSILKQAFSFSLALFLVSVLSACGGGGGGGDGGSATPPAPSPSAATCTQFATTALAPQGVTLSSSTYMAPAAATATQVALPAYCQIVGFADPYVGVDNLPYQINFKLNIPIAWNGRLIFTGGGGANGTVGDAITVAAAGSTPLASGSAIVAQDSGHNNSVDTISSKGGPRTFSFDPQARINYGYASYDRVTGIAKQLITAYQGRPPDHSYFVGCSEGGREAVMMTQRFPTDFDGIIAGDPQLEHDVASYLRPTYMLQTFAALAVKQGHIDRNGLPFINLTFSAADEAVLTAGITAACDKLDGIVDGMSQDFRACSKAFDPATLTCASGQTSGCLTADQVTAIRTQMAGIPGDLSWPYDIGMVAGQFASWWIGSPTAVQTSNFWNTAAYGTTYLTPPPAIDIVANNGSNPYSQMLNFKIPDDEYLLYNTTPMYPQSMWQLGFATGTDLSAFQNHGGKMMMYHGGADGSFTLNQTTSYWDLVNANANNNLKSFVRLYVVPGMGHCSGGPATSSFDMLDPLVAWVESGTVPDTVLGTAPANTPWPGRTRPLCTYPLVARYNGSGSIENASSFTCSN